MQRRGQRIARMAGEALAVEGEVERGRAVDQPALVEPEAGHDLAPWRFAQSRAVIGAEDLMRLRIALDDEPGAAAAGMMPVFVRSGPWDCRADRHSRTTDPSSEDRCDVGRFTDGIAEIGEFLRRAVRRNGDI